MSTLRQLRNIRGRWREAPGTPWPLARAGLDRVWTRTVSRGDRAAAPGESLLFIGRDMSDISSAEPANNNRWSRPAPHSFALRMINSLPQRLTMLPFIASVMGPAAIKKIQREVCKGEFAKINKRSEFIKAVMNKLIVPAMSQTVEVCNKTARENRIAIIEQVNKEHAEMDRVASRQRLFIRV